MSTTLRFHILQLIVCLLAALPVSADEDVATSGSIEPGAATADSSNNGDDLCKHAILMRVQGQYDKALHLYIQLLREHPDHPLASKIKQEVRALYRINAGHRKLMGDPYELRMDPLRKGLQVLNPPYYQTLIEEVISLYPEKWEPRAFSAQNLLRIGDLEKSQEHFHKALQLGGKNAEIAMEPIRQHIQRRLLITNTQQRAKTLIDQEKYSEAAAVFEGAWRSDPYLVRFGLQASMLHSKSASYELASSICMEISRFLKDNVDHPLAIQAGKIRGIGEQSAKAHELVKASTPPAGKPSTQQTSKPRKKASPLDLYKQRTR